jgi:hypothetical protein
LAAQGLPKRRCAGVQLAHGRKAFFDETELTAARLCDGATDFASPAITPALKHLAQKLSADGMAEACAAGRSLLEGQAFRQAKNSYIDGLLLSITNRCNFRCRHCFVEAPQGRYGELPKDRLFSLLDQFEEANVRMWRSPAASRSSGRNCRNSARPSRPADRLHRDLYQRLPPQRRGRSTPWRTRDSSRTSR